MEEVFVLKFKYITNALSNYKIYNHDGLEPMFFFFFFGILRGGKGGEDSCNYIVNSLYMLDSQFSYASHCGLKILKIELCT